MTQLTTDAAIQRFGENEERVDIFVNQDGFYLTNENPPRQVDTLISLARRNSVLNSRGNWATTTAYQVNDVVVNSGQTYLSCFSYVSYIFYRPFR